MSRAVAVGVVTCVMYLGSAANVAASVSLSGATPPVKIEARVGDDAAFVKKIRASQMNPGYRLS